MQTTAIQEVTNLHTITVNTPINNEGFLLVPNAKEMALNEMKDGHIIPVFTKDNMPTISQADFVQTATDIAETVFNEELLSLDIKVSHAIKGRTFEARHKKASELLEHERTVYFERMTFLAQLPIMQQVEGQDMYMCIAGVKAYNRENLNTTAERGLQRFQIAVGFKVDVCTNLCLWSDGANLDIRVRNLDELGAKIKECFTGYNDSEQISVLKEFGNHYLSARQFANIVGRARMYPHLSASEKAHIPELLLSDTQFNTVTKEYLNGENFSGDGQGINLWNFYNCLTEGVKSSYIDTFLEREVNAFNLTSGIAAALEDETNSYNWFLN